ncbi:YeiH family protein [Fervidibacillus halotolerans]|uniref:Sulfate exporter family transporter n=1 Tax=Fervidibacillus halotolerans TaxID=2980027 RepID=A0A9E8LZR8_9BACI|nr:putative sulfate exporter family transporter [Fervidibacillus halotolerans]WAA12715.1 putative sulfate exporter family transporter [Fervidibacillus halotolerans]
METVEQQKMKSFPMIGGVGFTFLIAVIGWGLAQLPGFAKLGPMALAIIIAIIYRQIWDYPISISRGIQFSAKMILRFAIVLYGLRLNIQLIIQDGLGLLAIDGFVIIFAIGITVLIAKKMNANPSISLLVGIGTGVCGAAAIAAVSPILKTKDEDTAISVGLIALIGTVFALLYSFLFPFLPIDAESYGIWSGISLHELAHVALAAGVAGQDALAIGLLAKLGRVFLLIPLSFTLLYLEKRKGENNEKAKITFPWFLIGFVVMSIIGSYITTYNPMGTASLLDPIADISSFLLTMAMVGLGLNIHLQQVRKKALKPLATLVITSILLSIVTIGITKLL